ncbi:MAG: hypothetical protein RML93_04890, partial [Anaerolineales bacterium]|nr:hypothetical protein [Anaerolineales bacterium]MDW8446614.1 hypothetical protein [Anaerolineales bacterium]
MPTLSQSLHKYDLSFLRNLARLWGLELPGEKKTTIIEQLTARILDPQYNQPMLQRLSPEARLILEDLTAHQGRLPLAAFARKYGELRRVGAGKRDREAIWRSPQNAAESLWFYGLIFLDFFEGETGIEEFVYLPPDLFPHLPFPVNTQPPQFEAVLSAEQVSLACATQDYLVDDTCTFLAWLRKTQRPSSSDTKLKKHLLLSKEHLPGIPIPLRTEFLQAILSDAGVLDINSSMPLPEPARRFLSLERWQRLAWLYEAWLKSTSLNELRQLEHIEPLGEWENDPRIPRLFITNQLRSLQIEQWYELSPFAQYIHDHYPDFQRPGGNYEVWLIRRRSDQQFLRGFESWFEVEGQLLRYLILGPLLWFGLVEVGVKKGKPAS